MSDNRFVALIPSALMPLCLDLHTRRGEDTGIAFLDRFAGVRNRAAMTMKDLAIKSR